jgi:L-seryl-tRNA(Ser) seleniumtransferase
MSGVPSYRALPSIDRLRQRPRVGELEATYGGDATLAALREAVDEMRVQVASGAASDEADDPETVASTLERRAADRLARAFRGSLRAVINATGIIIHTNLGRAPLAPQAVVRLQQIAQGYSNLEYDLERGTRGSRRVHAETLLTRLTGAEAAVVTNNNAAAIMLILAGLAAGREVIVSRGELVEIGGGFRVPDVMTQSGATLREVGTTNRTRVADYRAAISDRTALLLRVHPSNFRIEGFTERPDLSALVTVAREAALPLVEDLGSGCLLDPIAGEPSVRASIEAGVDIVCFSGDKVLGGPQAGIVVGRRDPIDRLQRHPLMRALRVDKLTLAALEGTLIEYLGGQAHRTVPVLRMIALDPQEIEARTQTLAERLHGQGWIVGLMSGSSAVGGGSAPGVELSTVLVSLEYPGLSANQLEQRLRAQDPPVVARIEHGRVVLDLRTVADDQDEVLGHRLLAAVAEQTSGART